MGVFLNGNIRKVGIFQTDFSAGCSPVLLLIIMEIFTGLGLGWRLTARFEFGLKPLTVEISVYSKDSCHFAYLSCNPLTFCEMGPGKLTCSKAGSTCKDHVRLDVKCVNLKSKVGLRGLWLWFSSSPF